MYSPSIKQSKACQSIIQKLLDNGYDAYMVGGCVRDNLLGLSPHDEDIATSAKPEDVKALFRTYDSGIKHGTVTAMVGNTGYEITTFRKEGAYSDNRRPDTVQFVNHIENDLERRDFTINAMAYNQNEGLIDPFHGKEDLQMRCIRCVGDPDHRFQEDALRMMRAIRFSATLDFHIESATGDAIKRNAALLQNISKERIRDEIEKILLSRHPGYFRLLHSYRLLRYISKDLDAMFSCQQNNPYHYTNVGDHTMDVLDQLAGQSKELMWAGLFHDIGKPAVKTSIEGIDHFYGHPEQSRQIADQCMRELHFDNKSREYILDLVAQHDHLSGLFKSKHPKKHINNFVMANQCMDDVFFSDFCKLKSADVDAHNHSKSLLKNLELIHTYLEPYSKGKLPRTKHDLAVNGNDLLQTGVEPVYIGKVQEKLLRYILEDPERNTKEALLTMVPGFVKSVSHEEKDLSR